MVLRMSISWESGGKKYIVLNHKHRRNLCSEVGINSLPESDDADDAEGGILVDGGGTVPR